MYVMKIFDLSYNITTTSGLRRVAELADEEYVFLNTRATRIDFIHFGEKRLLQVARDTGAVMIYADHFARTDAGVKEVPTIECQAGALRDDFDFGALQIYRTDVFREAVSEMTEEYQYAALYDLRLRVSRKGSPVHLNEYIYYETELDSRKSGEKLFDYVDPRNRAVQIEMEKVCTSHLKAIGAYLGPVFKTVDLNEGDFKYEASVVIPCRNRVRTIGDALRSALSQKTDFPYNVIVVDDNSTDGTVDVIKSFLSDPKLVYIAQDTTYHAIGGNWNAALHHPECGRFAIQLDSDDKYPGPDTVQKFVDAFRSQDCAMVVGTYRMTDFDGNTLPPGIIDHREWTPDNGRNNALRVNGFGAPRAFWVPLLRELDFPTTKYGEDYSVALRVSREYRIGRIYDVVYDCRRWDDNSDADCSVEKMNRNNLYKDRVRTWEIQARIALNKANHRF